MIMKSSQKRYPIIRIIIIVLIGLILLTQVSYLAFTSSYEYAETLAQNTIDTLRQQCASFNSIKSMDRTKELFYMNNMVMELSNTLKHDPFILSDAYLEEFVTCGRLSGVVVLDEQLEMEASGFSGHLQLRDWEGLFYPGCFKNILNNPSLVLSQRLQIDERVFDVCAVVRKDEPGVIVAYRQQSNNLLIDTENDLTQLLKNVHMTLNGEYLIEHDGYIISDSSGKLDDTFFEDLALKEFSAHTLSPLYYNGVHYFGTVTVSDEYGICVYFPATSIFRSALVTVLVVILLYIGFWLLVSALRTRSIRQERKHLQQANKKLRESLSILQSLQSIFFTVFYVDLANDYYESIFAAPWLQEVVPEKGIFTDSAQKLILNSVLEEYREDLKKHLSLDYIRKELKQEKITNIRHSYYYDYQAMRKEGISWCRITITLVDADSNGVPTHVLALLQDINIEKVKEVEYQQRILKEADAAQAANRAKSSFLFNMSHDMRTPMNAILGYADLAKRHVNEPKKIAEYTENICISGERLLSLINDVLELARIENNKVVIEEKASKAGDGLENCLVMIRPLANEKKVDIQLSRNIIHPYIFVDTPHMSQIALNILGNSVKFTNPGGHIRCTINQLPSSKEGYVTTELIISDDGIGISEEFLPHIFEAFARERTTTVSGINGTGLGMGIVKTLVDRMGGTIDVNSALGKGSTFTVRIPHRIADEKDIPTTSPSVYTNHSQLSGKRILLAEDNMLNAEIAIELLEEQSLHVEWAEDGEACLNMLTNAPEGYFDLVLMDIQMPVMDGYTAAEAIRNMPQPLKANIPIVAMTANAFPEDRQRALDAGMNDHISKPIHITTLLQVLQQQLFPSGEHN